MIGTLGPLVESSKTHNRRPSVSTQNKRVAVITGAAGGVGQSTVQKFAEHGYTVIGTDIRGPDGLFEHPEAS